MNKISLLMALMATTLLLFSACKDDPEVPNEEEVITTLNYTLTPVGGGTAVVLSFKDLDGDGGNAPVIVGGTLAANTVYNGEMELLNEQESPVEDITAEIKEEDDEHQFFFRTTVAGLTIAYADMDGDGRPLGLASAVTTTAAGSGTITITLRHEPNKSAAGVAAGDITNAGGETDIEVTFPVNVQ